MSRPYQSQLPRNKARQQPRPPILRTILPRYAPHPGDCERHRKNSPASFHRKRTRAGCSCPESLRLPVASAQPLPHLQSARDSRKVRCPPLYACPRHRSGPSTQPECHAKARANPPSDFIFRSPRLRQRRLRIHRNKCIQRRIKFLDAIQAVPRQFQRRHFPPPQAWSKFDDGFEASHGCRRPSL